MILSFKTKFPNGKPTYFITKIYQCFVLDREWHNIYHAFWKKFYEKFGFSWDVPVSVVSTKRHSIRKDEKNRWRPGMKVHFVINNRSKNFFQFLPVIECKSVQEIEIKYLPLTFNWVHALPYPVSLTIDGNSVNDRIEEIALNDGFDSVADFLDWFREDFTGKIIHWTDLKY